MNATLDNVLRISGWVVATGVVAAAAFFAIKKSNTPGRMAGKIVFSVAAITGTAFFVRWRLAHMTEGLSFENFGNGMMLAGTIVVCGLILSVLWTQHISDFLITPLTSMLDGGNEPPEQKPFYSIALTKRNRGKPLEAIEEIRRQLERFPNDFEGIMLLARMQAEDLADVGAAEITLSRFCERPDAPSKQVAAAYTQLADWHLRRSGDPEAARAALQQIIARLPDTDSALQAEQRIAHLSEAEKMILAKAEGETIEMAEGVHNVGLLDSSEFLKPQEVEPGRLAAAHVKHLETHPHDSEVREKLALIYARDFKRLDMATMELAQLINESRHPAKQRAHWLNLLATFQIELGADQATVRDTLQKIVDMFPDLPMADLARRRIAQLPNEFRGLQAKPSVKMGTYEQRIGLKYGVPRKR